MITWHTVAFWKPQSIAAFLAHCAGVEAPDQWLLLTSHQRQVMAISELAMFL